MKYTYRSSIQKLKVKLINLSTALVVALTGMTGAAPLLVTGTAHATADPDCSSVCINEVFPAPSSGSEWIEVYNPNHANLLSWSVYDSDGHHSSFGNTTDTYAILIPGSGGVSLNNAGGDTLTLKNAGGDTKGSPFTYPDTSSPTDRHDQSYGRSADGDTHMQWFASPTKGSTNNVITINSLDQLRYAVENQADGQTWNITAGTYGLAAFNDITVEGQTGWYFPITADNLTVNGVGNPTIYGTGFSANGAWHTQNLITVFGDNVTINGLTLMPKVEPNKTIEVLGSDFTLSNTTITPNTLTALTEYDGITNAQDRSDEQHWGGSVYFNNAAGAQTLENVTIVNGGISDHAPGATLNLINVDLSYATSVDWINAYRVADHGNTVNGTPAVVYHVDSTLNNLSSVLASLQGGDTVELDSDLSTSEQITLDKDVTFNGNGHTISPTFGKTGNDNNAALGIYSDDVTVNNLTVDGAGGTDLHGINVWQANDVNLNDVTVKNNDHSGLNVNGSAVTVNNLSTATNGWNGVDVDKTGAILTINGTSSHTGEVYDVYVDDSTVGQVVDTEQQYTSADNVKIAGDRAYTLKPADTTAPVITDTADVTMFINQTHTLKPTVTDDSSITYSWLPSDTKLLTNKNEALNEATLEIGSAPKGSYTVTLTVTDTAGNEAHFTYNVTVKTPANSNSGNNSGRGSEAENNQNSSNARTVAVLGSATTAADPIALTDDGSISGTSKKDVKGDSTNKPNSDTVATAGKADKDSAKTTSKFLGLGWWWLPIIVVVLGLLWTLLGRSANRTDTKA